MRKYHEIIRDTNGDVQMLDCRELAKNKGCTTVTANDLSIAELTKCLEQVFPYRYQAYVKLCRTKYTTSKAKQLIYNSAVSGEIQPIV